MRGALVVVALLMVVSSGYGLVRAYTVEPKAAQLSGWADTLSQVITCNFDSLSYVELFAGAKGDSGRYTAIVLDSGAELTRSLGNRTPEHDWVKFGQWDQQVAFTKGKLYEFRFTRSGQDSVNYYYQGGSPYQYGHMRIGGMDETGKDLCMRVYSTLNPVGSSYWAADLWKHVPWESADAANRQRLRDWSAALAESAGLGTMMIYAYWEELSIDSTPTVNSWYDFDAHLWEVKTAKCRPIINIQGVARFASSRDTLVWRRVWVPDTTSPAEGQWVDTLARDTSLYCAPLGLLEPDDSPDNLCLSTRSGFDSPPGQTDIGYGPSHRKTYPAS